MSTPLKDVRLKRGLTLKEVADAVEIDTGNLSRLENNKQAVSKDLAARLAIFYGHEVTEMQIIYPERYIGTGMENTPGSLPQVSA